MFEKTKINEIVAGVGPFKKTYKVINSLIQKAFSEMSQGPVSLCRRVLKCYYLDVGTDNKTSEL